jgi:phosphinothricin acetyltransferase
MSTQICSIHAMTADDWPAVRRIYLEGIAAGNATFETEAPTWQSWEAGHHSFARLVLKVDDEIVGWSALSKVSARRVYEGVAEVSVYLATEFRGRGFGRVLLEALIQEAERSGVWTLQASIFPENSASIELHRRCGFREVGRRERIAKLNGTWRDTVLLERRSIIVGLC